MTAIALDLDADRSVLYVGVLRIVEIGDGQVSDRKEWSAEQLVAVLEHLRAQV